MICVEVRVSMQIWNRVKVRVCDPREGGGKVNGVCEGSIWAKDYYFFFIYLLLFPH